MPYVVFQRDYFDGPSSRFFYARRGPAEVDEAMLDRLPSDAEVLDEAPPVEEKSKRPKPTALSQHAAAQGNASGKKEVTT